MSERDAALARVVDILRQHGLGIDDVRRALDEQGDTDGDRKASILTRVLAYLGGIFVFAGVGVFIAMNWEDMNFPARVVITLGAGIAAFVLAVIATQDERFEKAATPLFLIAAALEPTGLLVIIDEFYSGSDWELAGMLVTGTVGAQQAMVFLRSERTTLLFLSMAFLSMFVLLTFEWLAIDYGITALVLGLSLLMVSIGLQKTPHGVMTPFWFFIAASWALYGLFDLIENTVVEILFIAAASAVVYLSTIVRSRTLLFVATIALLSYIGYFSAEHFVQSTGWPVALMIFGLFLIGLSAMAFRINRRYIQQ